MDWQGIDVSKYQGLINWEKVRASGIRFAMIRTGYGDIKAFPDQTDRFFHQNMAGAAEAGVETGVYHFSYAKDEEEARAEAGAVLGLIQPYRFSFPVAYDFEYDSERVTGRLSRDQLTRNANAFLETIRAAQYYAMLYANADFIKTRYNPEILKIHDLWYARPGAADPDRACGIWQSGVERVPGISGLTDRDRAYKDFPAIVRARGLNGYSKEVVSDTTMDITLPENGVYTVKLTAAEKPDFTVGDGAVLKTYFARETGEEYYFSIIAEGKPGQSSGVYADGKKLFSAKIV